MRSIAVANQKGGVGKTTTAVNLACGLARAGRTVCLLDLDPQAHATLHVGIQPGQGSVFDVLTAGRPFADVTVRAGDRLWVAPAHIDLSAVDMALAGRPGRETILRQRIAADDRCAGRAADGPAFDYMIVDCPPSLGVLSLNALAAVDEVLLPLQPHFLALHGLSKLLDTVELVAEHVHPGLRLLGVVLCLYESGTRLAAEIGRDVEAFFRDPGRCHPAWREARLLATRIRRNVRLAEAPSFGQSIFDYAADSHGAADYAALAAEVDQAAVVAAGRSREAA